jgi:hypothetical protein
MFILSVDLIHHFNYLGVVNFFLSFEAGPLLSELLSTTLFDCSEVLVMLMKVFLSASALHIEDELCSLIFVLLVGPTTLHLTPSYNFDRSVLILV